MSVYISKTIRTKAIKFVDNMPLYCAQINFILEFSHAPLTPLKINKNLFANVILMLNCPFFIKTITINVQMMSELNDLVCDRIISIKVMHECILKGR